MTRAFMVREAAIAEPEAIRIVGSMILQGDSLHVLRRLPASCVQCIVASPPYWGLRDYAVAGQIGLESHLTQYINRLVAVFNEARRVLKDDGVFWGDYVLDPFLGSGTVGVVCQEFGRNFVGIELHPEYVMLAARRLSASAQGVEEAHEAVEARRHSA